MESAAALPCRSLGGKLAGALLQGDAASEWSVTIVRAAMLALFGAQALLKSGNTYLLGNAGEKIVADLRFNAAVRANIAYSRPEPTPEQIDAAARAARAHDFIVEPPQGYETLIGDRGARLSGGQRGCVALARALRKDQRP